MTIATWKAEFYIQDADKVLFEDEALQHSILKWTGLLKENLNKHGLTVVEGCISDENTLKWHMQINSYNCALCQVNEFCALCVLGGCGKEYEHFFNNGDPVPMLELLRSKVK